MKVLSINILLGCACTKSKFQNTQEELEGEK